MSTVHDYKSPTGSKPLLLSVLALPNHFLHRLSTLRVWHIWHDSLSAVVPYVDSKINPKSIPVLDPS